MSPAIAFASRMKRPAVSIVGGGGSFDPGTPTFFDDFDYTMGRNTAGATKIATMVSNGWEGMRDGETVDYLDARGYIYTVAPGDVAGHTGTFPSSAQRAILFEAHPVDDVVDHQTSYHINRNNFPANLWVRFWIYIADSGAMPSTYDDNNKFFYPADNYPAGPGEYAYLLLSGRLGLEHRNPDHLLDSNTAPDNELYFACQGANIPANPDHGTCINTNSTEGDSDTMYQNLNHATRITPNAWFEVTHHIDVSGVNGTWECWIRPRNGARVKVAEWIGGTTSGFTWVTPIATRDGFATMLNPESVNMNTGDPNANEEESYTLIADYGEAASFANLATYGDEP